MVNGENVKSQRISVFEMEVNALQCMLSQSIYQDDLRVKPLQHTSVAESTSKFRQKAWPAGAMLGRVDYVGLQDLARVYPGSTNMIYFEPWLSIVKVVC